MNTLGSCSNNVIIPKIRIIGTCGVFHRLQLQRSVTVQFQLKYQSNTSKNNTTKHSNLRWRTPRTEQPWLSKLQFMENSEQNSDYIIMMQTPIDLSIKSIREWWRKRKERTEKFMQQYIPERHKILGPDLAVAHFLLYRGGSVKFHGGDWIRMKEDEEIKLPNRYDDRYKLDAVRCDNMRLYYEGLENLRDLKQLKLLSFHNVTTFDNWCLDRVSGQSFPSLEILDISGTSCTLNGLSCLYRLSTLKLLIMDEPPPEETIKYQLYCSMLQEIIPRLKIVPPDRIH